MNRNNQAGCRVVLGLAAVLAGGCAAPGGTAGQVEAATN